MTLYYAGIGSRKAPPQVCKRLRQWGMALAEVDIVLRSGAAAGADTAFELGCDVKNGPKEIYLPWKKYQNNPSPYWYIPLEAYEIAADVYGSRWSFVSKETRMFMARDVLQILGITLDTPSNFVVVWTPDGVSTRKDRTKRTGGSGQAIALASELEIPVFNLKNPNADAEAKEFIQELINRDH